MMFSVMASCVRSCPLEFPAAWSCPCHVPAKQWAMLSALLSFSPTISHPEIQIYSCGIPSTWLVGWLSIISSVMTLTLNRASQPAIPIPAISGTDPTKPTARHRHAGLFGCRESCVSWAWSQTNNSGVAEALPAFNCAAGMGRGEQRFHLHLWLDSSFGSRVQTRQTNNKQDQKAATPTAIQPTTTHNNNNPDPAACACLVVREPAVACPG